MEDELACWACGEEGEMHHVEMHHVRGKRVDPNWVIPLCRTCHDLVDRKPLNVWPLSLYMSAAQDACKLPEGRLMMLKFLAVASRAEQSTTEQLAGFGRDVLGWIIANEFWNDASGDDFMPLAEKHGLAYRVPYDPEKHGEIDADEGAMIWWIDAAKLTTPPTT